MMNYTTKTVEDILSVFDFNSFKTPSDFENAYLNTPSITDEIVKINIAKKNDLKEIDNTPLTHEDYEWKKEECNNYYSNVITATKIAHRDAEIEILRKFSHFVYITTYVPEFSDKNAAGFSVIWSKAYEDGHADGICAIWDMFLKYFDVICDFNTTCGK
jgi:hypothetical protein